MQKTTFYLILIFTTLIIGFSQNLQAQNTQGNLSFFVRDAENELGLASTLLISGNNKVVELATTQGGHAEFAGREGDYTLTINSAAHAPINTYFTIESGKTVNIQALLDRVNKTPITDISLSQALIEGYVIDFASGQAMEGVSVTMDAEVKAISDKTGHYSFFSSAYNLINTDEDKGLRKSIFFSKQGYSSHLVKNLLMAPTKISLNITLELGNEAQVENYFQHVLDGTQKDVEQYEQNNNRTTAHLPEANTKSLMNSNGCIVPQSIRVGRNCSCTNCSSVTVMSLQTYTEKGIDDEWITNWQNNAIAAGSIAYRTYGAYFVNHPVKNNFDIASTTCNQVWGPAVYTNCVSAAAATVGIILTTDGVHPTFSEFSAENNGLGAGGASCGNCKSGTGSGYPCFSDNVCCGKTRFGHGRGMCQWGTQRWSQSGKDYLWIVAHYYSVANINMCGNTPAPCGTPSGLSTSSITTTSAILNWNAVSGANSYKIKYKADTALVWISTTSLTNSKPLTGLSTGVPYKFKVQTVCSDTSAFSTTVSFITIAPSSPSDSTLITVGNGTSPYSAHPFGTAYMDERSQYIITNSELQAAGWTNATHYIKSLAINVATASPQIMNNLSITLANCSQSSFANTSFLTGTNSTTVYTSNTSAVSGWNTFVFDVPFTYDGTSNVLVTICYDNTNFSSNYSVLTNSNNDFMALYKRADLATSGVCSITSGTQSYYRPNLKLGFASNLSMIQSNQQREAFINADELGSNSSESATQMIVFPNPFDGAILNGKLVIPENSTITDQTITINIFDLLGKQVASKLLTTSNQTFTLTFDDKKLQPGVYLLYGISNETITYKHKLVVR